MEEETGNECLINPEPQATEQPTNPQPTTKPDPEQNQEATKTPKQEEKKMSEADLNKFSVEELQAALEAKKAEEAKPKFVLDENDPSNLVKFLQQDEMLPLAKVMNEYAVDKAIAKYPGKLTKFAYLKDEDRKPTTDKEKVRYIHIVSVDGEYVVDELVDICSFDAFPIILEKI